MYTMIERTSSLNADENGKALQKVVILVDTAEDLPEADACWDAGSLAIVADTHRYKILNGEREWV